MKYKGYTAKVELDEEQGILFGRVLGLRDVITFEAETVPQAIEEFHTSVDSYLELCAKRGEKPEKPYSGQFMVRLDPARHQALAHAAEEGGKSLNAMIDYILGAFLAGGDPGHGPIVDLWEKTEGVDYAKALSDPDQEHPTAVRIPRESQRRRVTRPSKESSNPEPTRPSSSVTRRKK